MTAARADDPLSANLTQALNPLVSSVPPLVPVLIWINVYIVPESAGVGG
jgi:hypothetical protein